MSTSSPCAPPDVCDRWSRPGRIAALASLLGIVVFAYFVRHRYWLLAGGLEDYRAWVYPNYVGDIVQLYLQSAEKLLQGEWATLSKVYPPGYPAFLAAIKLSGISDPQYLRLVQTGVDSLGCLLAFGILRRLGAGYAAALLAALLYAIAPWWTWSSTVTAPECLLPVLTLAALFILLVLAGHDRRAAWLFGGLALAVLPSVRAEMMLFFVPLLVWGLLQTQWPWRRRISLSLMAFLGFAAPLLAIATANYLTGAGFLISRNLSGYVLFSGLGQVENAYGYFANDAWAQTFLNSIGLVYHSPESERYWKQVYWDAWLTHPDHVIATILYRFERILYLPDIRYGYFSAMTSLVTYGPGFLLAATAVLLVRRQYAAILLIAGPLGYALATNGIMYMELRYIRYAHVTYLLAAAIAFDGALSALRAAVGLILPSWVGSLAAATAAAALFFAIGQWSLDETRKLDRAAVNTVRDFAMRRASSNPTEEVKAWTAVVPGATVTQRDASMVVTTSTEVSGYQAMARVPTAGADGLVVNFDIVNGSQQAFIGILKGDGSVFLRQEMLAPRQHSIGTVTGHVDDPNIHLVVQSTEKARTEVVLNTIRYALVCEGAREERYAFSPQRFRHLLFPRVSDWSFRPCAP